MESVENESSGGSLGLPQEVSKPWVVYLMAAWAFFGIGGFLTSIVRIVYRSDFELLRIGSIAVMVFVIVIIVHLLKMRRNFIILFGILCIGLTLWQLNNVLGVLITETPIIPSIYFYSFYIIPSVALAICAFRPSFLVLADKFVEFKKYEAMKKVSLKSMRR